MSATSKPESALRKEWSLFKEGFARLVNAYLNMMFDLSPKASSGRFWAFVILFFVSGFLLSLIYYPLNEWLARVGDIFLYVFNADYRARYTAGDPVSNLILFARQVFFDPRNLRFIPLLLAPYFISLQSAAIYLADIFNLDDVSTARRHIVEVALGGSDETIRISKGDIAEEDKKSANYLIGGPGKVVVELDSAALFEKPDGAPRVIGPTHREPGGKATLEGFERFREAIDLRDQFVELRDLDPKAGSVSSRSRDGIPIIATDVRFMFSVDRVEDGTPAPASLPYPFSGQAVENLVYKAISKVTPEQEEPSTYVFLWKENMTSLIRGELAKFMNKNELNKYFASVGQPEVDRAAQRENLLANEAQNLLPLGMTPPEKKEPAKKPEFFPRPDIKANLFGEFVESFNKTSRERGVKLHWVSIGTWRSPVEKVFSQHIEAWKISRENAGAESSDAWKGLGVKTVLQKMADLIRDIPLGSFHQASSETKNHTAVMRTVLVDYRKQLIQARDLWTNRGESAPVDVEDAIRIIEDVLWHSVGRGPTYTGDDDAPEDNGGPGGRPPFTPSTGTNEAPGNNGGSGTNEAPGNNGGSGPNGTDGGDHDSGTPGFAYADLIRMVGGDGAAANRLIEHERAQFPNESQDNLVARAIDRLIQDRQR